MIIKKSHICITLLLLLLFPINVKAVINLACQTPIISGNSFTCNLTGTRSETLSYLITLPSGITYSRFNPSEYYYASKETKSGQTIDFILRHEVNTGIPGNSFGTMYLVAPSVTHDTMYNINFTTIKQTEINTTVENILSDKTISLIVKAPATTTTTKKITKTTTTTTQANPADTYTLTLNHNNKTEENSSLSCTATSGSCSIDLKQATVPTYEGYSFQGWGNTVSCESGNLNTYSINKNSTLYACWVKADTTTLYLKSLDIKDQQLIFSKFQFSYELKVLYEVSSLEITALPASDDVTVKIDELATKLEIGDNTINIVLTDTSNNSTTYILKVNRLKEGEILTPSSSDATLKSVSIGKINIDFVPTSTNYDITVPYNTKTLDIVAVPNDENSSYEIAGNTNITETSVVIIKVTAEDGTINIYKFNVNMKTFWQQYNIFIIAGGALLFIIAIYAIIKLKKKKPPTKKIAPVKQVKQVKSKATAASDIEVLKL